MTRGTPDHQAPALSGQEMRLLRRLAAGKRTAEIARELQMSIRTVRAHRSRLYQALGATDWDQAITRAFESGLLLRTDVPAGPDTHAHTFEVVMDAHGQLFERCSFGGWWYGDSGDWGDEDRPVRPLIHFALRPPSTEAGVAAARDRQGIAGS